LPPNVNAGLDPAIHRLSKRGANGRRRNRPPPCHLEERNGRSATSQ
jgi:hypothetical protein